MPLSTLQTKYFDFKKPLKYTTFMPPKGTNPSDFIISNKFPLVPMSGNNLHCILTVEKSSRIISKVTTLFKVSFFQSLCPIMMYLCEMLSHSRNNKEKILNSFKKLYQFNLKTSARRKKSCSRSNEALWEIFLYNLLICADKS